MMHKVSWNVPNVCDVQLPDAIWSSFCLLLVSCEHRENRQEVKFLQSAAPQFFSVTGCKSSRWWSIGERGRRSVFERKMCSAAASTSKFMVLGCSEWSALHIMIVPAEMQQMDGGSVSIDLPEWHYTSILFFSGYAKLFLQNKNMRFSQAMHSLKCRDIILV